MSASEQEQPNNSSSIAQTDGGTTSDQAQPASASTDTTPSAADSSILSVDSAISTRDAGTDTTSPALTAPVTIFVDGTAKTFNPGDKLGLPTGWGRSDWHIRTYRKIFVGYSTSGTDAKTATTFYRDSDTIDTVIAKEGSMDGKALHAVFITQDQIFDFLDDIGTDSSKLAIGVNHDGEGSVTNADVKEEKGFTGKVDATDRLVTEYYESDKDKYTVSVDATFEWNKPYIPMLVAENPLSFIKSANDVTDFSGENPTNYTYEDLKVVLDSRIKTATTMNNLTLTSSLFTVAAVLDENYNVLPTTVTKTASDSNLTTFSFENPNSLTTFIVRTIVRNYGLREPASSIVEGSTVLTATGAEVTGPMILTSGDATNLYVDKETALAIAKDEQPVLKVNGNIGGSVALDKTNFTGAGALLALFMPNNLKIETNNSLNNLNLDFEFNYVKYDKNSIVFETGVEQNLGTSAVVHNNPLDADELNSNTKPTAATEGDTHLGNLDNITVNDKTYVFKGWNTQADGSGLAFDGTTLVSEDITVYAIWEEKKLNVIFKKNDGADQSMPTKPKPEPRLEIKPESNSLPKTGESSSMFTFALGMMTLIGSLGIASFKKRED